MNKITMMLGAVIGFAVLASTAVAAVATDKTLVAWAAPANLTQGGGSILTVQIGDSFDGIVLGELQRGKWMAGSNVYSRSEKTQDKYPAETTDAKTMVQISIVYKAGEITIYRNGLPLLPG